METETVTLVASTVATVTIPQPDLGEPVSIPNIYEPDLVARQYGGLSGVVITILSGTTPVFASVDGSDPTVGGDDFYAIAGAPGQSVAIPVPDDDDIVVKLISSGTPMVSVVAR